MGWPPPSPTETFYFRKRGGGKKSPKHGFKVALKKVCPLVGLNRFFYFGHLKTIAPFKPPALWEEKGVGFAKHFCIFGKTPSTKFRWGLGPPLGAPFFFFWFGSPPPPSSPPPPPNFFLLLFKVGKKF